MNERFTRPPNTPITDDQLDEFARRLVERLDGLLDVVEGSRRLDREASGEAGNPRPLCEGREHEFVNERLGPKVGGRLARSRFADQLAICGTCRLREPCGDYAVTTRQEYGIWGGMLPLERKRYESD